MIISKKNQPLPKQIKSCPIIDANCEIRFEPLIGEDRFFGAIYSKLQTFAGNPTALPNLNIPAEVRQMEASLKFAPLYKFSECEFPIQVGPRHFSIGKQGEYAGWGKFSAAIIQGLTALEASGIVSKITRVGIRYINFFEQQDIFENIDLDIRFDGQPVAGWNKTFSIVFQDRCKHRVKIKKDITVRVGTPGRRGSVIDIDSFQDTNITSFKEAYAGLEMAHEEEKKIFFGLLKTQFLNSFSPTY